MFWNGKLLSKHSTPRCYWLQVTWAWSRIKECKQNMASRNVTTPQMPREDEAHLFIEHCLQFSVTPNSLQNNIPSQNLLMIKQTRMISKTEKKISSSCFNILSRSDTASATMLKNLKNIGMQTIHFLAFTKLIS